MSPPSPSLPSADSRLKWRKRKRASHLNRPRKPHSAAAAAAAAEDDENNNEGDGEDGNPSPADAEEQPPAAPRREAELITGSAHRISDCPPAIRRTVARHHPSVLAAAAACSTSPCPPPFLENVSYGQLQVLSSVPADHSSLQPLSDSDPFVCTPPPLTDSRGVAKRLPSGQILLVPAHSDWFSATTVHRLERQVMPHFFTAKPASPEQTPEKYMLIRNRIISKYLENPERRMGLSDYHTLLAAAGSSSSSERLDPGRIIRFLDSWGIINFLASSSDHSRLRLAGPLIKENTNGELVVQTQPLRSIESVILFDRPKCSISVEEISSISSSSASASKNLEAGIDNLDARIRERFSEFTCSYCSCPLPGTHYQSQKEVDTILCRDCYHHGRFIIGHSSLDFHRVDSKKDASDLDGDNWSDQETLLLLEAIEKYNENWNEIAEHVGTKSKAQCILHFIRLPMEEGFFENIEIPHIPTSTDALNGHASDLPGSNSNGDFAGGNCQDLNSVNQPPFSNSANPLMSLVAFLASAVGPRVAATCANAALSILTKGDSRLDSEEMDEGGSIHGLSHQKDVAPHPNKDATHPLDPRLVKHAAQCGLYAAATKAKLFADQEEREIQKLCGTIISHQLKRQELKLKQFAEMESMLMTECEKMERARQRMSADRAHITSSRPGPGQPIVSGPAPTPLVSPTSNQRPPVIPGSMEHANMRPQLSYMQRQQQQLFGFGPRQTLSTINPSIPPSNPMFSSGLANNTAPKQHPSLRPSSGNSTNVG